MRGDGRDVGVGPEVEYGRAVGEGLLPGRADLLGLVDRDAAQAEAAGESLIGDVGELLGLG
jgi:hypothetical protein